MRGCQGDSQRDEGDTRGREKTQRDTGVVGGYRQAGGQSPQVGGGTLGAEGAGSGEAQLGGRLRSEGAPGSGGAEKPLGSLPTLPAALLLEPGAPGEGVQCHPGPGPTLSRETG